MNAQSPLYDQIGQGYDNTRQADPYLASCLQRYLEYASSGLILDVACGTGNYTRTLKQAGFEVVGVDRSLQMLSGAAAKDPEINWILGDVSRLPFDDNAFDAALCTLATHHFGSLENAFREIARVMSQGSFVIFTATPEQMRGYWLNEYFPVAMADSIEQMPNLEDVQSSLASAGFRNIVNHPYEIQPDLQDHFLYSGKLHPERYLDENFRAGISTFSSLANRNEVASGCERLHDDLQSGKLHEVMRSYEQKNGDYLFIVAKKESS